MLLLVDDNDAFRQAAAEALQAVGLAVAEAVDAEEAWAIFSEEPVTLLVTDLRLPGMSGETLARRCVERRPQLPVVIVSSHADADLAARIGAERVEILSKPVRLDRLAARCKALLAGEPAQWTSSLRASTAKVELPAGPAPSWTVPEETPAASAPAPLATPGPGGFGRWPWVFAAALAAVLALALAFAFLPARPPETAGPSPPAASPSTLRVVEPIAPTGPIGERPSELAWRPVPGAALYRVSLRAADDHVLVDEVSPLPRLPLPPSATAGLRPAAAYFWQVDAADSEGRSVAASERIRFRIVPRQPAAP
jgi:CheY-like chemotaxis protein